MTISTDVASASYTGNGTTQIFPVPFYFLVDTDLKVSRKLASTGVVSVLTLNSDYTVSDAGDPSGGSITMLSVPASGDQIFIERNVDAVQETAYPENGPFPASSHEKALDRLTMLVQQLQTQGSYTLARDPLGGAYDLGGYVLTNTGTAVNDTDIPGLLQVTQIAEAIAAGIPGGVGSFTQAGAGAVSRTFQDKMRERVSVKDFGAVGDGTTDDATAIQTALNSCTGKVVVIDAGYTFAIGTTITIPTGTRLRLDGKVFLKNGVNKHMLTISAGNSDIVIEGGGTLDGNRTNQTTQFHAGIYIAPSGANRIRISGITITNVINWPLNMCGCFGVLVENCTFTYSGNSVEFAQSAYNCGFQNCTAAAIDDYGFAFYGGVHNAYADGCISHDNGAGGIVVLTDASAVAANYNITIKGCHSYSNLSGGIESLNIGNGTIRNYDIIIIGNHCHHNGQSNSGVGDIRVTYCNNLVIANNICHESGNGNLGAWGIQVQQVTYGSITGNIVWNEGIGSAVGQGLSIQSTATNLQVANNMFVDTQGSPTTAYHINGSLGANVNVHHNFIGANSIGVAVNLSGNDITSRLQDNSGWNPTGPLTAPTLPASGTGLQNPFPYPVRVAVYGGTVTQIGFRTASTSTVLTNLTSGAFILAPGEYIAISYSVAPTWKWYGL